LAIRIFVIPAKAGLQPFAAPQSSWIPAFAGMTEVECAGMFEREDLDVKETGHATAAA
jgi:hypothetical protein